MAIFERKGATPSSVAASQQVLHRLTKDLVRAERLAVMVAKSRAAGAVEIADLLAGMYLNAWERLEKYWEEPQKAETFLSQLCHVSPQRWHKWMLEFDRERELARKGTGLHFRRTIEKRERSGLDPEYSQALSAVLRRAGQITPFREKFENRSIPILTSECVLLAILEDEDSEVAQKLSSSGLDLVKLQREAKSPKHAPLH
jgi:hypothetical protein